MHVQAALEANTICQQSSVDHIFHSTKMLDTGYELWNESLSNKITITNKCIEQSNLWFRALNSIKKFHMLKYIHVSQSRVWDYTYMEVGFTLSVVIWSRWRSKRPKSLLKGRVETQATQKATMLVGQWSLLLHLLWNCPVRCVMELMGW